MSELKEKDTNGRSVEYRPSETAMATAFIRVLALQDERKEVKGPDYLAEVFVAEDRKRPLKDSNARILVMKNRITPGMYEFIIARTAFFDHVVLQALQKNVPQIVFLGAGYDTRPYRFKDFIHDTRIFELDFSLHNNANRRYCIELVFPYQINWYLFPSISKQII